jgi:SAM-dependent methyltransferase
VDREAEREAERERLRLTFDAVAAEYQEARPDYPPELWAELLSLTRLRPAADPVCEVGSASGKATLPLARLGYSITCVELGAALAAQARRNLAGFERVTVVNAPFETWQPDRAGFALLFAATAWRWIDPAVKYQKAAALLRPGGYLAFWEAVHVLPDGGDPFFLEIQDVYDAIGSGLPDGYVFARPDTLASAEDEVAASGLFSEISTSPAPPGSGEPPARLRPGRRRGVALAHDRGIAGTQARAEAGAADRARRGPGRLDAQRTPRRPAPARPGRRRGRARRILPCGR